MRTSWLRNLFVDNAMLEETTRVWRGLQRGGHANSSRALTKILAGIIAFFYFWFCYEVSKWGADSTSARDSIGLCAYMEMAAITLILPASVYGAIAGERERGTWEALILTRLTPGQIIFGKAFWRILVIFLLMLMTLLPSYLSVGIRGGKFWVGAEARSYYTYIFRGQMLALGWGTLLSAFGLWISAGSRRSVSAASSVFVSILAGLILLPVLYGLLYSSLSGASEGRDSFALFAYGWNPFYLLGTSLYNPSTTTPDANALPVNLVVAIYFSLSILFVWGTHVRLRRLEEPKRKAG